MHRKRKSKSEYLKVYSSNEYCFLKIKTNYFYPFGHFYSKMSWNWYFEQCNGAVRAAFHDPSCVLIKLDWTVDSYKFIRWLKDLLKIHITYYHHNITALTLNGFIHGLRMPREKIVFTARPKIRSHSQIFRYGRSIFCLPHRPNFSDIFDLCLHWVSLVPEPRHC